MQGFYPIGIPGGWHEKARSLTVRGADAAAPHYRFDEAENLDTAIDAVRSSLKTVRPAKNQYTTLLPNRYTFKKDLPLADTGYGLSGLGGTDWLDVAKTFVGAVGTGIGNKISGVKQQFSPPQVIVQRPVETPSWLPIAAIGGAALLGYALLRKRA